MHVSPAIALVGCIPPNENSEKTIFTAIDLLNVICDGLCQYRVPNTSPDFSVSIKMPPETFNKFMSEMRCVYDDINETELIYGHFKFSVTKND